MPSQPASNKKPNLVSVTTINRDGSRFFLHPADVGGKYTVARRLFALLLVAVYVLMPWVPINGHPAMFFDVANGRFHVLGLTFLTQDLWLLFFLLSGFGFALIYITSLFGRLWCGWACPYTVFLEHLFRRIERWIDGDAVARRKLDAAPWDGPKILRRVAKHSLFLLCAAAIAHLFLSYFVSLPKLYEYMRQAPGENLGAFGVVAFLTVVLYFCFAWFREQFCIILCPYGRIQSALTDDDTMIIAYDPGRGEPRGKKTAGQAGDCIDCRRCVQVCPTGIDIRNGLQLECIGCANCIDACDDIMDKIGRPRGLVRYDSLNGLGGKSHRFIRPRTVMYTVLLFVGVGVLTYFLGRLKPVYVTITRMTGPAHYVTPENVRNQFKVQMITKRNEPTTFHLAVKDAPDGTRWSPNEREAIVVAAQSEREMPFIVTQDRAHYKGPRELTIRVTAEPGGTVVEKTVEFLGPDIRLMPETPADPEGKTEGGAP